MLSQGQWTTPARSTFSLLGLWGTLTLGLLLLPICISLFHYSPPSADPSPQLFPEHMQYVRLPSARIYRGNTDEHILAMGDLI